MKKILLVISSLIFLINNFVCDCKTMPIPLISVIIPIYNVEEFLDECLESAINQTYRNLEIILVNDGSSGSSLKICEKYQKKDRRIVLGSVSEIIGTIGEHQRSREKPKTMKKFCKIWKIFFESV